jgi:TP901 family phage tail tape measure protein
LAGKFSIEAIFSGKDGLSRLVSRMAGATHGAFSRFGGGLAKLDAGLTRVIGSSGRAALGIGAIGVAAGTALAFAGQSGMEFEAAMSNVAAVSNASTSELAALEERAIALGASTKFSSGEVVGAMESMSKAGLTVEQILAGVGGVLSATAADGGDLQETATSLMAAMKGLGMGPEKMQLFADQLALAGDSTAASIGSIAESMGKFGPVVRQLGIPVEAAIAQIALLQDAGLDASMTGTGLAAVYSKLAAPVGATKKALKDLGIEVADSFGNMKPPTQLMTEILSATSGIEGNVGKMAAMTNLVGLESQKALLNMAATAGSGELDGLTKKLRTASDYADGVAAKKLNNLKGDLETLGGAVDSVKVSLFKLESGSLRGIVQGVTSWIDKNQQLIRIGFIEFMEDGRFAADAFGAGMRDGFGATVNALESVFGPLTEFAGIMDGGRTWPDNVRLLGEAFGFLVVATAGFLGFTLAVKAARLALFGYQLMVGFAKGVTWLFNAALVTGRTISLLYTIAWLYWQRVAQTAIGKTVGLRLATIGNTIASKASALWTGIKTLAQKAWNLVAGTSIGRLATLTGATYAQAGASTASARASMVAATGLKAVALAAGAALAAIGAVMVAWDQWKKLEKESGGLDGVKSGLSSLFSGEGYAAGVDKHMNEQARKKFEADKQKKLEQSNISTNVESKMGDFGADAASMQQLDALMAKLEAGTMLGGPGLGSDADIEAAAQEAARTVTPEVVDTTTKSFDQSLERFEQTISEKSELIIKDHTGRAELTHTKGEGKRIKLDQSGAFNG